MKIDKKFHKETSEICWDNGFEVESIIWIAAQRDVLSEPFVDFCSEESECLSRIFGEDIDMSMSDYGGQDSYAEDVYQCLMDIGKLGFLVRITVPMPDEINEDGSFQLGGMRSVRWVYSEDLLDIKEQIVRFSQEIADKAMKRQNKKKSKN